MPANGRNNSRYVRNNHRVRDKLPPYCTWPGCPQPDVPIDFTLPPTDRMSWTTDHTVELAQGGSLYGERTLMHRACNSQKERQRQMGHIDSTTEDW